MALAVDHQALKTKILDFLKANNSLWDNGARDDPLFFRSMELGSPDANKIAARPPPALWITADDILEDMSPASGNPTTINSVEFMKSIVHYLIIFVAQERDSQRVEERLDTLQMEIIETLRQRFRLANDVGNDWLVNEMMPVQIGVLNRNLTGKNQQGRVIRVRLETYLGLD